MIINTKRDSEIAMQSYGMKLDVQWCIKSQELAV